METETIKCQQRLCKFNVQREEKCIDVLREVGAIHTRYVLREMNR